MFCFVELDGSCEGEVIAIDVLHVITHFKHIIDDAAINGLLKKVLRLEYHVVAPQDTFGVGIVDELVHKTLTAQVFLEFSRIGEGLQLVAIVVGVFEAILSDSALADTLGIIWGKLCSVFSHKVVWHDTASAIDGASDASFVFLSCLTNAVLAEEFTALITGDEIHLVFFGLSLHVGLLDASARGSVVARNSQMDEGTVCEFNGLLY